MTDKTYEKIPVSSADEADKIHADAVMERMARSGYFSALVEYPIEEGLRYSGVVMPQESHDLLVKNLGRIQVLKMQASRTMATVQEVNSDKTELSTEDLQLQVEVNEVEMHTTRVDALIEAALPHMYTKH
jgi:hypothetical protein